MGGAMSSAGATQGIPGIDNRAGNPRIWQNWYAGLIDTLQAVRSQPLQLALLAVVVVILCLLVIYPVFMLAKYSFIDANGQLTLHSFEVIRTEPGMAMAAFNSLRLVIWVTAGAIALGLPLAWLVGRTDMPGKWLIRTAAAISFTIPPFITVIAWIFLAAPNSGYLNKFAMHSLGLSAPPLNVIGFGGLVFIEIVHLYPLVFFAATAALSNIDASYEQSARVLGAGRLHTALTVTLPLITPALVSSAILCSLDVLSSFGAPAALGSMANFSVLTTKLYDLITYPPKLDLAAAASSPIVCYTLLCLLVQRYVVRRGRYVTVAGRATAAQATALGIWRYPALLGCLLLGLFTAVLPVAALLILSLLPGFGADISFSTMVGSHYTMLFDDSFPILDSIRHSMMLAFAAASICLALGFGLAWLVERTSLRARGLVTAIVMLSYGFPSIAFGVGILLGYINLLYGTLTIILLAYVAKKLPIAFVFIRNALQQIAPDLEAAARVAGAGWLRALFDITLPLLRAATWTTWILVFSLCMHELPMSALLTQSGNAVISTTVVQYIADGAIVVAAAMSVLIVAIGILALGLAKWLSGRAVLEVK
jgi:iron(III) transport system permease protein